jgi:M6 family metalloprotease-like protein
MRIRASLIYISATVLAAAVFSSVASAGQDTVDLPALPKGRPAGVYQREALAGLLSGTHGAPDTLDLLVIRVSYADMDFTSPPHDSIYFANELRHAWEYFKGASLGAFGLGWEISASVTELRFNADYYGEEDLWEERVSEMLMEAVEKNDDLIDFSRFDAFALIHPGPGQETDFAGDSPWQLWSGFIDPAEMEEVLADTLGTPGVPTNDRVAGDTFYVDNVMVLPENSSQDGLVFGSLGIYVYQVGMRLGMIPMYDTTPSGYPDSQGIGAFGLMGYGIYNASGFIPAFPCAFHRHLMGWSEAIVVEAAGTTNITDVNTASPADTALVRIEISPTEYFLVSNRLHDANMNGRFDFGDVNGNGIPENEDTLLGAEFDFFLTATTNPYHYEDIGGEPVRIVDTGSGMMIWHIDETIIRNRLAEGRYPNDTPGVSGVDLEEADGVQDLDRPGGSHAFGSWGDSYRENWYSLFGPGTIPASLANTGTPTGITIEAGSAPGRVMRMDAVFGEDQLRVTGEIEGTVMSLSPIAAQLDGDEEEELIQAADTGYIYVAWDAGMEGWDGSFERIIDIPGAVWTGAPIAADLDGTPPFEVIAASGDGRIHVYRTDGSPYPIDTGDSPGSIDLPGETVSMAMAFEADGDAEQEAVLLASDGDTTWIYLIGHYRADQLQDGSVNGEGLFHMAISLGRAVAHPVLCADGDNSSGGFYSAVSGPEGEMSIIHVEMIHDPPGMSVATWSMSGRYDAVDMILPAAGDIDGNGTDDLVMAVPGGDLVYFDKDRGEERASIEFDRPSPPSLADMDGDGILETIIRDRSRLFLLTGFGTSVTGWPVRLEDRIAILEPDTTPAQPVSVDTDGDGRLEAVFNVAGELWAHNFDSSLEGGWPIRGEGDYSITPLFSAGTGTKMLIFVVGGSGGIAGPDQAGMVFFPGMSTVSRIDPQIEWSGEGMWPMYRNDVSGTSRQGKSEGIGEGVSLVDGSSLICYPNPAGGTSFSVRLNISERSDITVRLFDLEGNEVFSSQSRHEWEGSGVPFETTVPTGQLSSGIYICHVLVRSGDEEWGGARKIAVLR